MKKRKVLRKLNFDHQYICIVMRFKELLIDDKRIVAEKQIIDALERKGFHWLIDSEVEKAKIEIKHNTLIWHSGSYYSGNWYYGIFKGGEFYGVFENGIFEKGNFKGEFKSGMMFE